MHFSKLTAAVVASAVAFDPSQALNTVSYSDPGSGLDISLAIPDVQSAPFPLYMTFTAPIAVGWGGFATGGCMLRSPLIVAWPNNNSVLVTTRWAKYYHAPTPYLNTTIAVKSSSVNATHWTATFLCSKGCSDWYGGSIDPSYNNGTFGYAASSSVPAAPGNASSPIKFHDLAIGHFDWDLTKAKNSGVTVFG